MEATSRACHWVRRRLPLLVGGELAVSDRRKAERHLIGCLACQDRRDASVESLSVLQEVAALRPVRPDRDPGGDQPSVWPALARQIHESRHQPSRRSRLAWSPRELRVVVGPALAAGLILGLVWSWSASRPGRVPLTVELPAIAGVEDAPIPAPVSSVVRPRNPADVFPDSRLESGSFDELEVAVVRLDPHLSALPDGEATRGPAASTGGPNPFQPPLTLRLDYDLDRGTVSGPAVRDAQRAY